MQGKGVYKLVFNLRRVKIENTLLLYCCFTSTVNIYGHVGTVS